MMSVVITAVLQAIFASILASILPVINQLSSDHGSPKALNNYPPLVPRIAYGEPVNITDYPYFVALRGCGGAIIAEEWVVTAAHCVYPQGDCEKYVFVGGDNTENSELVEIEDIIVHPFYMNLNAIIINDIALIKLVKPLKFHDRIQPLQLPSENQMLRVGSQHEFIGKGEDEAGEPSERLTKMEVGIFPSEICYFEMFPELSWALAPFMPWLNNATICSIRVEDLPGAGYGDSGSPLAIDGVLVGISSCAAIKNSSIMFLTNVAHYVPWIKSIVEEFDSRIV